MPTANKQHLAKLYSTMDNACCEAMSDIQPNSPSACTPHYFRCTGNIK